MVDVLAITGPVYLIILAGWLTTRWGWFSRADMRVLGRYVLMVALPALLFYTLSQRTAAEVLQPAYLAVYAGGSLLAFGAAYAWALWVRGKGVTEAAFFGMGASCSNTGFIGFPLLLQVVGPAAGAALALNMVVENVLMLPLVLALAGMGAAQAGGSDNWRTALRTSLAGLVRNPLIIAIALGLLCALSGLHLPAVADRAVALFATSAAALALFVIGGSLSGGDRAGLARDVPAISVAKLVIHPLAVFLLALLVPGLDATMRTAAIVSAAVPMLGIYPVLAQRYGLERLAAATQLVATLASFVTLTLLIWWLRHHPF